MASLQNRLAALRYDVGPIDGAFGSQTLHGVVASSLRIGMPVHVYR